MHNKITLSLLLDKNFKNFKYYYMLKDLTLKIS